VDPDGLAINTIRMLAVDAVQKAKSGHPGTPMDAAPTAYVLWQRFLRYDPAAPDWPDRDRFVLSAGHASMLLYALLHLAGVRAPDGKEAVTLADIEAFRQAGSHCPGHPEHGVTAGVETTTGPLGQGAATSVGMAIAGRWLAGTYNRPDFPLFGYRVYALCGDGDMMEGITSEAASLAAHQRLANLCWIYDSNRVTIEGHTDLTFSEDVASRFLAYGWNVTRVSDANDLDQLTRAYREAAATADRPTLIIVPSHIGYGAPHKQDSPEAHGEPLGDEEVRLTKKFFGFDPDKFFVVPDGVRAHLAAGIGARGAAARSDWEALFARYRTSYPALAAQLDHIRDRTLPEAWEAALPSFAPDAKGMATRDASGKVLNALAERIPWLLGGAADLSPSTKTRLVFEGAGDMQAGGALGNPVGRNMHFGIREHAMCAIVNGMVLSGLRAFGSGFLIFTDYARGAIRLSSLMDLPVMHIWTHDSISVGEDGPTHEPIEQLVSLRAIPGMVVIRPADANEMAEAYRCVLGFKDRPAAIICSRQALPTVDRNECAAARGLAKGAYVLIDGPGAPSVILIASGSEVSLCLAARKLLASEGVVARIVSMPSWELFEAQGQAYRESVLPPSLLARVTVEEGSTIGWDRYAGPAGIALGMHTFGLSAPIKVVAEHFGFTPERVAETAKAAIARSRDVGT
ncbi:MAG TPA: transketolase, partial [Acetobacteraceae bacterium]|nr:transketolase [Acetobacteraceae bacterium]